MPSFTYTSAIPAGTDIPSQSQSTLQTNCTSVNGIMNVDLYGFNNANGGQHQQVTFAGNNVPSVPTSPPVLFTNTQDGAGNTLPGSIPELFFYSGSAAQGQNNYVSQSNGSTLLMGGIVLKWGQGSIATGGAGSSVSFPVAFPNNCFTVVVSGRNAGNTPGTFNVNAVSNTAFTLYANTSGNFYYIAIGN